MSHSHSCTFALGLFRAFMECTLAFVQELDQMRRVNARKEEDMLTKHGIEKKRLPRIQKSEMKTRQQLFKQSLRISQMITPEQEKDKIRQVSKRAFRLETARVRRDTEEISACATERVFRNALPPAPHCFRTRKLHFFAPKKCVLGFCLPHVDTAH